MMTNDEWLKVALASCIVHLLESMRPGGRGLDLVAAQGNLQSDIVKEYLEGLDPVLLPLPRDGEDKHFEFPEIMP